MKTQEQEVSDNGANQESGTTFPTDFPKLLRKAETDLDRIEKSLSEQSLERIRGKLPYDDTPHAKGDVDVEPIDVRALDALKTRIDKECEMLAEEGAPKQHDGGGEQSSKSGDSINAPTLTPPAQTRPDTTELKHASVPDEASTVGHLSITKEPGREPPAPDVDSRPSRGRKLSAPPLRKASEAIDALLTLLKPRGKSSFVDAILHYRAEMIAVGAGIVTLSALVLGTFHFFGKVVAAHPPALPQMLEYALRATPADLSWATPLYLALGAIVLAPLVITWLRHEDRAMVDAALRSVRVHLHSLEQQLRDAPINAVSRRGSALQRGSSRLQGLLGVVGSWLRQRSGKRRGQTDKTPKQGEEPGRAPQFGMDNSGGSKLPRNFARRALLIAVVIALAAAFMVRMLTAQSEVPRSHEWLLQAVCLFGALGIAACAGHFAASGVRNVLSQFEPLLPIAPRAANSARWAVALAASFALLAGYSAGFPRNLATIQAEQACALHVDVTPFELGDERLRLLGRNGVVTELNRESVSEIRISQGCPPLTPRRKGIGSEDIAALASAIGAHAESLALVGGDLTKGLDVRVAGQGLRLEHVGSPTLSLVPGGEMRVTLSTPERIEFGMPEPVRFAMADAIRFDPLQLVSAAVDDVQSYATLGAAILQHCMSAVQYKKGFISGRETRTQLYESECNNLAQGISGYVMKAFPQLQGEGDKETLASAEEAGNPRANGTTVSN